LEHQVLEERQKLVLLQKLASAGFEQLDQGRGTELDGRQDIGDFLRRIGERAAKPLRRPSTRGD
jgi:hypothetical protein